MGISVRRGEAVSALEFPHVGHSCQVEWVGLNGSMDPAFRETFPLMYEEWGSLARGERLQAGDHLASTQPEGRIVHTLGVKQGMRDEVDLEAVVTSVQAALRDDSTDAIAFHRIGTRCQGRLPWHVIASALESVALSASTEVVVFTDEWDDLVDALGVGQHVEATVTAAHRFGAFLELGWPFEGFIDVAELSDEHPLEPGQSLEVEVLMLDDAHQQVRAYPVDPVLRRPHPVGTELVDP